MIKVTLAYIRVFPVQNLILKSCTTFLGSSIPSMI